MRQGVDRQHFDAMRRSRNSRHLPRGTLAGHRAAKKVWTCAKCLFHVYISPYAKPYTKARPQPCPTCKTTAWVYSASKGEASRYVDLQAQADIGVNIRNLVHPPKKLWLRTYSVHNDIGVEDIGSYTADYTYEIHAGNYQWSLVYEDYKPSPRLENRVKLIHFLVWHQHGIDVLITWHEGSGKKRKIQKAWSSKLR